MKVVSDVMPSVWAEPLRAELGEGVSTESRTFALEGDENTAGFKELAARVRSVIQNVGSLGTEAFRGQSLGEYVVVSQPFVELRQTSPDGANEDFAVGVVVGLESRVPIKQRGRIMSAILGAERVSKDDVSAVIIGLTSTTASPVTAPTIERTIVFRPDSVETNLTGFNTTGFTYLNPGD